MHTHLYPIAGFAGPPLGYPAGVWTLPARIRPNAFRYPQNSHFARADRHVAQDARTGGDENAPVPARQALSFVTQSHPSRKKVHLFPPSNPGPGGGGGCHQGPTSNAGGDFRGYACVRRLRGVSQGSEVWRVLTTSDLGHMTQGRPPPARCGLSSGGLGVGWTDVCVGGGGCAPWSPSAAHQWNSGASTPPTGPH